MLAKNTPVSTTLLAFDWAILWRFCGTDPSVEEQTGLAEGVSWRTPLLWRSEYICLNRLVLQSKDGVGCASVSEVERASLGTVREAA